MAPRQCYEAQYRHMNTHVYSIRAKSGSSFFARNTQAVVGVPVHIL